LAENGAQGTVRPCVPRNCITNIGKSHSSDFSRARPDMAAFTTKVRDYERHI